MKPVHTDRSPGEESLDCYPGLVVSDGKHSRACASITIGRSRLPMWAIMGTALYKGWKDVEEEYYPEEYNEQYHSFDREKASEFFYNLMEHRGEFGRLILILADVERCSTLRWDWTETRKHTERLADQLERCLRLLRVNET